MNALNRFALSVIRGLIVLALAIMVVVVFANVVLRYGFNSGISISEELARYLFVWLTFLGSVLALHESGHLGTDALVARLSMTGKKVCAVLGDLLVLACCALILIGSWKQMLFNMDNASPVSGLPIGLMYMAGVVSSFGMLLIIGAHLGRVLTGRASEAELIRVAESEEDVSAVSIGEQRS